MSFKEFVERCGGENKQKIFCLSTHQSLSTDPDRIHVVSEQTGQRDRLLLCSHSWIVQTISIASANKHKDTRERHMQKHRRCYPISQIDTTTSRPDSQKGLFSESDASKATDWPFMEPMKLRLSNLFQDRFILPLFFPRASLSLTHSLTLSLSLCSLSAKLS